MYESTSSATRCFSLRSSLAFKLALTFTLLLTAVWVVGRRSPRSRFPLYTPLAGAA
jgi:hypothetical protein